MSANDVSASRALDELWRVLDKASPSPMPADPAGRCERGKQGERRGAATAEQLSNIFSQSFSD